MRRPAPSPECGRGSFPLPGIVAGVPTPRMNQMGPSILFDKSAIQSLGHKALQEVSRYFYTVVPPVLLMETLADLSLNQGDVEGAKRKVAEIASKVFPINSIANAHYHTMCVHNLLGDPIPM